VTAGERQRFVHGRILSWYRREYPDAPERMQRYFADSLHENTGMTFGLDDAYGYSPAEPERLLRFMGGMQDEPLRMYSLLGVRAFVALTGTWSSHIPLGDLRMVAPRRGARFAVLENPQAVPEASLVREAVSVSEADVLAVLRMEQFDPGRTVVLEGQPDHIDLRKGERNLRQVSRTTSSVAYQVTSDRGAFLLRNVAWSPGWEATIDGEAAEVHRANFLMQAVEVPGGAHTVEFRYRPRSFLYGGMISLGSLLLLAALAVLGRLAGWNGARK
jgi:hypothetical protein